MARQRFGRSNAQVVQALIESGGHIGKAARLLGVNDSTLRGVIKRNPPLQGAQRAIIRADGSTSLKG